MTSPMRGRGIRTLEEDMADEECPWCKGEGDIVVDYWRRIGTDQSFPVKDFCPACQGTGKRQPTGETE